MTAPSSPAAILATDPEWWDLYQGIRDCLVGGQAIPLEEPGPPVEGAPVTCIEDLARAMSTGGSPRVSLGVTFPLALVAASVACQGAVVVKAERSGDGDWLRVPVIEQATVIAPSGYGKSTALVPVEKLLTDLNRDAAHERQLLVNGWLADLGTAGPGVDQELWGKILRFGVCRRLTLDSGTPEGMRSALLAGGGVAGVLTAEPDVLREINGYAKDGGTFRWLLDGWDAHKIGVLRATREMVVPRAALPYAIMVQPAAFDEFNQSRAAATSGRSDAAISRGLYGRSWLVRITTWEKPEAWALGGGSKNGIGPVAAALGDFKNTLGGIFGRTNAYRAAMGVQIGWHEEGSPDDSGLPVELGFVGGLLPKFIELELEELCTLDYGMLQNMRLALAEDVRRYTEDEAAGQDTGELSGMGEVLMPLISRVVQHALRVAALLALTDNPACGVVPLWALRDAVFRWMPWLMHKWSMEMWAYRLASLEYAIEADVRGNPGQREMTTGGMAKAACIWWFQTYGDEAVFSRGQIMARVRDRMGKGVRDAARALVGKEFDALAATSQIVMVEGTGKGYGAKGGMKFRKGPKWGVDPGQG